MARLLSEEKRNALLSAAASAVALAGVAASTTRIAKDAGVAEGTLFIYFPTKDELLNQLYLDLNPISGAFSLLTIRTIQAFRSRSITSGVASSTGGESNPDKRKALRQLSVSERIT